MKFIACCKFFAAVLAFTSLCATADDQTTIKLGGPDGVQTTEGPSTVSVAMMDDCNFTMQLLKNQHIKYNNPDAIFYDSSKKESSNRLPYLWQAPMSSGYDWNFKTQDRLDLKWFGLMCENIEDFYWSIDKNALDKQTSESQQIMEDNSERCPADYKNGKFTFSGKEKNTIFRPISHNQWRGFIYGNPSKHDHSKLVYAGFCVIHKDKVIVGNMGDPDKELNVPISFLDEISNALSTLQFIDKQ
ncbi:hypothetical protein [Paraburkholderia bannensis]|uniref:hypothetical protein n=1 Tax=Paraburkholderia bannensis TaxID=765414 RepID=UPI002AB7B1ED|nr:hypothetical protein [Paraburkholderia bannensis]